MRNAQGSMRTFGACALNDAQGAGWGICAHENWPVVFDYYFWLEWMTFWTLRPGINDEVDDSESADKRNAWSAYEAESENKKNGCKDVCCKFCGQQFR